MNHVKSGITAVYDRHSYDAEKRRALDLWGSCPGPRSRSCASLSLPVLDLRRALRKCNAICAV